MMYEFGYVLARYFRKMVWSLCSNIFMAITLSPSIVSNYSDLFWDLIDHMSSSMFITLGEWWVKLDLLTLANLNKNGPFIVSMIILESFGSILSVTKQTRGMRGKNTFLTKLLLHDYPKTTFYIREKILHELDRLVEISNIL